MFLEFSYSGFSSGSRMHPQCAINVKGMIRVVSSGVRVVAQSDFVYLVYRTGMPLLASYIDRVSIVKSYTMLALFNFLFIVEF